jgi:hypothetical protein
MTQPEKREAALDILNKLLSVYGVDIQLTGKILNLKTKSLSLNLQIAGEEFDFTHQKDLLFLSEDYLFSAPEKVAAILLSRLNLNSKIFARKCDFKTIDKETASYFLNTWHLMGATTSGSNRGLFLNNELVALASFSKGRKMNRLTEAQRSFELIRFCCKPGFTITGGLTKLVKNFYTEKQAGDIMTYVDKQMSDGKSFLNAGFKKHSELPPNFFLIDKKTNTRILLKDPNEYFDQTQFYKTQNSGSIKMIFSTHEKL